tara:strand:- start:4392 stop:6245 length:1854 start_codon:yes stop_codon:yes gene_type:complete
MAKPAIIIGDGKFATKDTKFLAYAQGDSSSRFVARELTYDRGSNLTATRVASNGLIEKGRENLILQSNSFDTTWSSVNVTVTGGQEGYDGSSNAWELKMTGAQDGDNEARIRQTGISVSGVCTYSVFAKAGNVNFIRLIGIVSGSPNPLAFFDLSGNGSVISSTSSVAATSIESFGNGWFRVSVTHQGAANNITDVRINISDGDDDVHVPTGSFIYIQDSQLEAGLVATDVITTTSAAVKAGILEDQARVDYLSNSNGYILLEPTRQNLILNSEHIGGSTWTDLSSGVTAVTNDAVSPEGVKNATKLVIADGDSAGAEWRLASNLPVTNTTKYAFSVFAKAAEFDGIQLDVSDSRFGNANVTADLTNGTITAGGGTTSSSIEDHGDGWYRIIMVATCISTGDSAVIFRLHASGINGTGDGSKGIHVYGAQFEEGAFATSYIPTHGTAASRSAEGLPSSASSVDMSSFMEGDDVTLVVHFADNPSVSRDSSSAGIQLSNGGAATGKVAIYRNNDAARQLHAVFFGTDGNNVGVPITSSAPKIAIRRVRSSNAFTVYMDGAPLDDSGSATDSNGDFTNSNFDVTWDDLKLSGINSTVKILSLKLFDSALTNPEMESETS